jgi:hypothetical protein
MTGQAVQLRRRKGETSLHVPLARLRLQLTADGETALLGIVHYYLASWASRAHEGQVHRPRSREFVYRYTGTYLELPVLDEAEGVQMAATVQTILDRGCSGAVVATRRKERR